ncbi:MAG: hypothetical protein J4F41_00590 [Alphaproteobacteria bacterium]|nr:hypothetical protein [Alphaproteobacteria bacterium]
MKTIVTLTTLASLAASVAFTQTAAADQTKVRTIIGNVSDVEALTTTYVRKTPIEEKVCRVEEVPIYEEGQGGDELGGLIIGGLIGSAVGNAATDAKGAGTFGAITGALVGREHAKNSKTEGKIVGYRQQDVCEIQKSVREERVEEVTGYRLTIDVDGDEVILKTKKIYDTGDEIRIRRKTTYSLD